jgi:hypothetical protein
MSCAAELAAAESCVTASASACSVCIPAFADFKLDYENEYKRTLAFEAPGTDIFCERSNFYVCEVMKDSDCCCNAEIDAWAKCAYEKELGSLFDVTCSHGCGAGGGGGGGGEGGGEGGGGSMMMIMIAAVVVVLLCCCCGGCWYRRRKRRLISGKGVRGSLNVGKCCMLIYKTNFSPLAPSIVYKWRIIRCRFLV